MMRLLDSYILEGQQQQSPGLYAIGGKLCHRVQERPTESTSAASCGQIETIAIPPSCRENLDR